MTARPLPARLRTVPGALAATFVLLLGIYLLSPVVEYGDGRGAGPTAASIVTRGDLVLDPFSDLSWYGEYQMTVVDGHTYDFYPWTRSLFAVPVALGLEVGHALGLTPDADSAVRSDRWERVLLVVPGSLATAGAAVLAGLLASRLVRDRRLATRTAVATALAIGLATGYWSTASRGMWQHGPACLWFTIALLGADHLRKDGRAPWAAVVGATATAAVLTRPLFAFLALALVLWCLAVAPRRAPSLGVGILAVAVPVTLVNLATFGAALMPYYSVDRAGKARPDPLLNGLLGSIASPARGILVFMPAVVVAAGAGLVMSRRRGGAGLELTMASAGVVLFVFTATSPEGWWAGHSFGPRFSLDLLPVMALLAAPVVERGVSGALPRRPAILLLVLLAWSTAVNATGAIVPDTRCWNGSPVNIDDDRSQVWAMWDSQALSGFRWLAGGRSPLDDSCH